VKGGVIKKFVCLSSDEIELKISDDQLISLSHQHSLPTWYISTSRDHLDPISHPYLFLKPSRTQAVHVEPAHNAGLQATGIDASVLSFFTLVPSST
jgi:hypothetical protein